MTDRFIALSEAVISIKKGAKTQTWWKDVNKDVVNRIYWVLDNIDKVGVLFANTFTTLFKWELARRKVEEETVSDHMMEQISVMLDMKISEETYQSGILPTRSVLNLYDYISPSDADVQACLYVCMQIKSLEKSGLINLFFSFPPSSYSNFTHRHKAQDKSFKWVFDD